MLLNAFDLSKYSKEDWKQIGDAAEAGFVVGFGTNAIHAGANNIGTVANFATDKINKKRTENALLKAWTDAVNKENAIQEDGAERYSFEGYDEKTGKGIYKGNFPKGTPKKAKAERILNYIQDVWSKNPITLKVDNADGTQSVIEAKFDPYYSEDKKIPTDASKLMGGNRHGTSSDQRVTLDLADDYYQILSEAIPNGAKYETGKDRITHSGVTEWHYLINDILFEEYEGGELTPYRVSINVKQRDDGNWVYSFSAENQNKRPSTRQTLHADVNQTASNSEVNAQPSTDMVTQSDTAVKENDFTNSDTVGVVRDEFTATRDEREIAELDEMARRLGLRVQFVDGIETPNGSADASIKGNVVKIDKNTTRPYLKLMGHEVTHYLQAISPEAYAKFEKLALKQLGNGYIENVFNRYNSNGVKLDPKGIIEEAVADYAGALVYDGKVLDKFISDNRSDRGAMRNLWSAVRSIKDKLFGNHRKQVEVAEAKLTDAINDDIEQFSVSQPSYDELIAKPPIAIIDIGNNEEGLSYKDLKTRAISKAVNEGWFDKPHHNNDTGFEIFVSKDAYGHAFNNLTSSFGDDTILAMEHAPEIIETAVLAKVDNPKDPTKEETKVYTFFGAVRGKNGVEPVKITVKEYDSNTIGTIPQNVKNYFAKNKKQPEYRRLYDAKVLEVVSIEKEPSASASVSVPEGADAKGTLDPSISVADLLNLVNGDARKYIPEQFSIKMPEADTDVDTVNTEELSTDEKLSQMREDYGTIPKGEKPFRDVELPERTAEDKYVSQTVRTILEAKATPDVALKPIETLVAEGELSFDRYTDKAAIADANATIKNKGWANAYADWKKGGISKKNTSIGWALYNNAVNSDDMETAIDILSNMVGNQRDAAQALQATQILKKLSPEGQLYQVQRSVSNLQEELNARHFGKKPELKINETLATEFMKAETQDARDEILKEIYRDIGSQMPNTFADKWRAWRYLAMLGNPRTHVRNILGNAFFAPVVNVKNALATGIESAAYKLSGGKFNRTKAYGKGYHGLVKAAYGDYANVADVISSGGKYGDGLNENQYIRDGQKIFTSKNSVINAFLKPLEWARQKNSNLMESEDRWFSKPHYATALAQYCKANGITEAQIKAGEIPADARAYAIKEAQKATYRDTNAVSAYLSTRSREDGNFKKTVNLLADGVLPFRKTPANILMRGIEYSPLGLGDTITRGVWDVSRGNITGAEFIDKLSSGLTGTGLVGLGVYLAAQGLVRGHGSTDDEENEFERLQGHQAYSLELPNGASVTLDWLAPEALPFFIGVNLWETANTKREDGEELKLGDYLAAVGNVSEPMLEMSCLQGLNDMLDSVKYDKNADIGTLVYAATESLLSQNIPTLLGQMERTFEPERMTTYTDRDSFWGRNIDRTLGKWSAKIPFWDYQQIPYVDAWGGRQYNGDFAERAFNNFLNPAYISNISESDAEKELKRLYDQTGEGAVFPSRADNYFKVDGKNRNLSDDEYVDYSEKKGGTALEVLTDLFSSTGYKSATDKEKADMVGKVYDYSNQKAKNSVEPKYVVQDWVKHLDSAQKYDISKGDFIYFKNVKLAERGDASETKAHFEKELTDGQREVVRTTKKDETGFDLRRMTLFNVKGLTPAQKAFIDKVCIGELKKPIDYTSEETFYYSQLSDAKKKRYPEVKKRWNLDAKTYYRIIDACSGAKTKAEKISRLMGLGLSKNLANALYDVVFK